jgi:hypothetical protein
MKRGTKIALIVLAVVLGIGIVLFISADVVVSHIALKQVNKALASLPEGEASCGGIEVRLFSGTAAVKDLRFDYRGEPVSRRDTVRPGASIHVDRIEIGRVFYSMLMNKELLVYGLEIDRPQVELWMDEKHPELCFPAFPQDTTPKEFPLKRAELLHFHLKNASLALHSVRTKLDVQVDSCSLAVHHLAYDSVFHYCDSVYALSLAHAKVMLPDGRMHIETHDIAQEDQGALTVGNTRIANTMAKKRLGDIVREPVTWLDMTIAEVSTAPFNPVRKALAEDLTLKEVQAVVERMDVFRDLRYKPKHTYPMPQEVLMALPVKFDIRHVDAQIKRINVELASTETNIGQLTLQDIHAGVDHVSNRRGAVLKVNGGCPVDKGQATAMIALSMNKDCDFAAKMHVTDANVSFLSPFIRPLVGMTADCEIDTLDTEYEGNNVKADGTFRMLYHGLNIQVHKEDDIPYKIITRNANTFTTLGNSLIPKSNPTVVDIRPRAYKVTWKRNEWQEFPLYLFGPCIDGVKKTFLPGLYVHMQTK